MGVGLSDFLEANSGELEKYIKQIKIYEAQAEIIEASVKEEEQLKNTRPKWTLVLWSGIAGIQFHVDPASARGKRILKALEPGVELTLKREPDNKYDRWAIAIYTPKDEMLGYVTRFKNESIARLMDSGFRFHAIVENEMQVNYHAPYEQRAVTENYQIPFSVWME